MLNPIGNLERYGESDSKIMHSPIERLRSNPIDSFITTAKTGFSGVRSPPGL